MCVSVYSKAICISKASQSNNLYEKGQVQMPEERKTMLGKICFIKSGLIWAVNLASLLFYQLTFLFHYKNNEFPVELSTYFYIYICPVSICVTPWVVCLRKEFVKIIVKFMKHLKERNVGKRNIWTQQLNWDYCAFIHFCYKIQWIWWCWFFIYLPDQVWFVLSSSGVESLSFLIL